MINLLEEKFSITFERGNFNTKMLGEKPLKMLGNLFHFYFFEKKVWAEKKYSR